MWGAAEVHQSSGQVADEVLRQLSLRLGVLPVLHGEGPARVLAAPNSQDGDAACRQRLMGQARCQAGEGARPGGRGRRRDAGWRRRGLCKKQGGHALQQAALASPPGCCGSQAVRSYTCRARPEGEGEEGG